MNVSIKFRIKDKYKSMLFKYAWTKLDLNGEYTMEEWTKAGFKELVLEKC